MSDADEFGGDGGGAAETEPIRAGEVKKGMIAMLKDKPCKVSKSGTRVFVFAGWETCLCFVGRQVTDEGRRLL